MICERKRQCVFRLIWQLCLQGRSEVNPIAWWCEIHGEVAPIGFALRSIYKDRWIRFHSLPDSKRYPGSEEEMQEVVHRATTVANTLFEPR